MLVYNGIRSDALNADVVIGQSKFAFSPEYRINTVANESNDGDVNYTTYNSAGRMLANSREIETSILVRRRKHIVDGVTIFGDRSELMSDVSEVVNWLKSDDYKQLVIQEMPDIEWSAIASISNEQFEIYNDGVIITAKFKCKPFTCKYIIENIYLGSDIPTDSTIVLQGKSGFEATVSYVLNTVVPYGGTAVSKPRIKLGDAANKVKCNGYSINVAIDNMMVSIDTDYNEKLHCEIDTENFIVYINNIIDNSRVHVGSALPYLSGNKPNVLTANGFNGKITLDYKEYYDLSYLGV